MARAIRTAIAVALAAAVTLSLPLGCKKTGITYIESGNAFTRESALAVLAKTDASSIAARPTSEGPGLRHNALARLRRLGPAASSAADLLTRSFPSDTTGVPVHVERGTYNTVPVLLVVEATGPSSGSLSSKRLWIVSEAGDILFAGSR